MLLLASCGEQVHAPKPDTVEAHPASAPPQAAPARSAAKTAAAEATKPDTAKAAERTGLVSEVWYRSFQDGQPSGWRHVRWTRKVEGGRALIHDRTEGYTATTRDMGGESDTFEARDVSETERTEDGMLLSMTSTYDQAGRVTTSSVKWTGTSYEATEEVRGLTERHTVTCDAPCPVDTESFLSLKLQRGEVKPGAHFQYRTPNYVGARLDTVDLAVAGREKVKLPDGVAECFRVTQTVGGRTDVATWWLDDSGVVRKLVDGRSSIEAASERTARDLRDGGAVYSITLSADPEMPRCTSLDRCVVDLTFEPREGMPLPDFPPTSFSHEVSRSGNVIRIELTAHDEAPQAGAVPAQDPTIAKGLERTNLLCWDAPRVKQALASAVGDETDPAAKVRKILRFVFATLKKGSGPIPQPTAVEILEDGGGDCSEHCVLFVTLCRAAGIPARRLSGYAQVGNLWGAHSFAEVWLGRWIGCDPTTNEFGTKARYVAFGWDDDADSYPGIVGDRVTGRMKVRTVEFTEQGRTWRTKDVEEPGETADPLSGIEFAALPAGWTVSIPVTGRAQLNGPGVRATLMVHAGWGDIPCDLMQRSMMRGLKTSKFGPYAALRDDVPVHGHVNVQLYVPFKRRMVSMTVRVDEERKLEASMAQLAALLAPMLGPAPRPSPEKP